MFILNNLLQGPICSSWQLECVNQIKIDTSKCLKPCSGVIVSSLIKSEKKSGNQFPTFKDYDDFKINTGKLPVKNV